MAANSYDIGDIVVLTGVFTTPSGTLEDPDVVTCTVRAPDGTESTPSATKASTGTYTASVAPTQDGAWWYAFDGTGSAKAAGEQRFLVRPQRVPR